LEQATSAGDQGNPGRVGELSGAGVGGGLLRVKEQPFGLAAVTSGKCCQGERGGGVGHAAEVAAVAIGVAQRLELLGEVGSWWQPAVDRGEQVDLGVLLEDEGLPVAAWAEPRRLLAPAGHDPGQLD
jgi:hypothetical protein